MLVGNVLAVEFLCGYTYIYIYTYALYIDSSPHYFILLAFNSDSSENGNLKCPYHRRSKLLLQLVEKLS